MAYSLCLKCRGTKRVPGKTVGGRVCPSCKGNGVTGRFNAVGSSGTKRNPSKKLAKKKRQWKKDLKQAFTHAGLLGMTESQLKKAQKAARTKKNPPTVASLPRGKFIKVDSIRVHPGGKKVDIRFRRK